MEDEFELLEVYFKMFNAIAGGALLIELIAYIRIFPLIH